MPPSLPSIGLPGLPSLPGRGAASTIMELRGQMRSELFRDVARGAGPQFGRNAGPGFVPGSGPGAGAHPQAPGQHVAAQVVPSHAFGRGAPGPSAASGQPDLSPAPTPTQVRGIAGAISQGQFGPAVSAATTTIGQTGAVVSTTVQALLAQGRSPAQQSLPQGLLIGDAQGRQATASGHLPGVNIPGARAGVGQVSGANVSQVQTTAGRSPGAQTAGGPLASPSGAPLAPGQLAKGQPASAQPPAGPAASFQGPATPANASPGQPGPLPAAPGMPHPTTTRAPASQALSASISAPVVAATQAPAAPQGAVPIRADGMAMADRAALQPASAIPANPAAAQAGASPQAAAITAPALPGNPQAANVGTNPLAQQAVATAQAGTEARGNTVMHGADRGAQRTDGPLPHGHTVEAGHRRPGLRGLGAAMFAAWWRPGAGDSDSAIHRQADYVFQWLYWALTITAWLCLGLLIVVVTPLFGPEDTTAARSPVSLGMIAAFAGVGLCAALTAWLVSRVRGGE